jgi:hypothetical protein
MSNGLILTCTGTEEKYIKVSKLQARFKIAGGLVVD